MTLHYGDESRETLLEDAEQALVDLQEECCGSCEFTVHDDERCTCTILWAAITELREVKDE